ncbi:type VI secretion system protein TssA, partial [bacterium LRH843]|nr:type VI secretion system protein TssA [bacterium LRH843]
LGLLQGSINHLIPLIKQVAIVNVPAFSLSDYDALLRQKNHLLKQVESYTDDANSSQILEQFEQSLFNTSKSFQYQNYQHFSAILAEWSILKSVLDALMGLDALSFAALDTQLVNIHTSLTKLYKTDV